MCAVCVCVCVCVLQGKEVMLVRVFVCDTSALFRSDRVQMENFFPVFVSLVALLCDSTAIVTHSPAISPCPARICDGKLHARDQSFSNGNKDQALIFTHAMLSFLASTKGDLNIEMQL